MPTRPPSDTRLYFLDWVRIIAFALLLPFHVGMYYVSWGWHVKSAYASAALEPWMLLSSPWRMSVLFVVSGAATAFMLAARGADGAWLGQRAKRLGLPLLFGMAVLVPPQSYLEVVQQHGFGAGYVEFVRMFFSGYGGFCRTGGECLILPTWNHLWFLPYLLCYTALLWLALRRWPGALDALAARLPMLLRGARLLWLPVLWLVLTRWVLRDRFPPTYALAGDWFQHAQFFVLFLLGAALARSGALWPQVERLRLAALLLALLAWATMMYAQPAALRSAAVGIMQWCAIVAALGYARRHLNRDSAARRWLTEAVFPLYLVHQTLIIVIARVVLEPLALPVSIEGPLLLAASGVACFAVVAGVRRVAVLRPLFGLPPGVPARQGRPAWRDAR